MNLSAWIELQRSYAQQSYQRRLVVISGSRDWGYSQLMRLSLDASTVWLGTRAPDGVEQVDSRQAQRLLGRTVQQLVVDAWDGLNPNALAQAAGTLVGGGLLVLLCPPLAEWPDFDDPEHRTMAVEPYSTADVGRRFIQRLVNLLNRDPWALIVREQGGVTRPTEVAMSIESAEPLPTSDRSITPTADQQRTVQAILHSARNRRQPLVITADRGRGKSAALGMAAAELLQQGRSLLVTAPSAQAAEQVFEFAQALLPDAQRSNGLLQWQQAELRFMEPDRLLNSEQGVDMLLVDEAAAIPAPVLSALLERFNRIIFATTTHGYEGTGRGFSVRFRARLDALTPRWRSISLTQPIRWAEQDPVEALIFRALLLDADAATDEQIQRCAGEPLIELLDRDKLVQDHDLLSELFGLLVLAHYRTTPGDLRLLLDSPNLRIWCAHQQGRVLACALIADEGPLDAALAQDIWAGRRRPPGHLLPQTLIAQAGFPEAAPLKCARIMRIAVHPALRRQRLGEQLLEAVSADACARGLDYLGASFAASPDLVPFWQAAGYQPVRLGLSRDAVSGTHALLVMKPVSTAGETLYDALRYRYSEQVPLLLYSELSSLERALIPSLLAGVKLTEPLSAQDLRDLEGFAAFGRTLDSSRLALRKLALALCSEGLLPEDEQQQLLLIELLLAPVYLRVPAQGRRWYQQQLKLLVAESLPRLASAG